MSRLPTTVPPNPRLQRAPPAPLSRKPLDRRVFGSPAYASRAMTVVVAIGHGAENRSMRSCRTASFEQVGLAFGDGLRRHTALGDTGSNAHVGLAAAAKRPG